MGQYQTRASKSVDEEEPGERGGGEPGTTPVSVPRGQETAPPLAPVFGSPIDSKPIKFDTPRSGCL